MSQSFSQTPPVYSISNPTASSLNQTTPYPIPPYPTNNFSSMPMPMPMEINSSYSYLNSNRNVYPTIERQNQRDIPEEVYRESLRTAILDKIQNRFNEINQINKGEIDSLNKTNENLNQRFNQINQIINQIQQQQNQIQVYIHSLLFTFIYFYF
jgi:hypothetical protein